MINEVYNVLQIIANKNNYGLLTPDRFNYLADVSQMKLYDFLGEEIRRAKARTIRGGTGDDIAPIQNTLDIFTERSVIQREALSLPQTGFSLYFTLPDDFQYLESVWYKNTVNVEELDKKMGGYVRGSYLANPTLQYPLYEKTGRVLYIYPEEIGIDFSSGSGILTTDVSVFYHRRPKAPKWTYLDVLGKAVFNPSDSTYQDFELPDYWFNKIVIEMALLMGIHLREQEIEQVMQQQQNTDFQKDNV
jgi:hypothetical protein